MNPKTSKEKIEFILKQTTRNYIHECNQWRVISDMLLVLAEQMDRIEEKLNERN